MAEYIVNAGGVVQLIRASDWAAIQAGPESYRGLHHSADTVRKATPEEIAAYWDAQGFTYDPVTDTATPKPRQQQQ